MRIEEQVDLGDGRIVTVRELTVAEIRAWLLEGERPKATDPDVAEVMAALYHPEVIMQDLARMTDAKVADMDDWTYSQFAKVLEVCKRLNPPFFSLLKGMIAAGEAAIGLQASQRLGSSGQP